MDDFQEVRRDRVQNPRDNHTVRAHPCRISGEVIVTEDMILQGEMDKDEQDIAAPLGVVGGLQIKNDWDQVLDVLHSRSLVVQMIEGSNFRGGGAGVAV
jgi:hypothetical protein